MPTATEVIKFG